MGLCSNGEGKGNGWSKQGPPETHTPLKNSAVILKGNSSTRPQRPFDECQLGYLSPICTYLCISPCRNGKWEALGLDIKPRCLDSDPKIKIKPRVARLQEAAPSLVTSGAGIRASNQCRAFSPVLPIPEWPFPRFPIPIPRVVCSATAPLSSIRPPRQARLLLNLITNRLPLPPFPVPRSPFPALRLLNVLNFDITPSVLSFFFLLTRHLHVRFCPIVKYRHIPATPANAKPQHSKDHPTRPRLQAFQLAP